MFSTITAKYPTTCKRCGGDIRPGDRVRYGGPRVGCYHLSAECPGATESAQTTDNPRPRLSLTCPTCKRPDALSIYEAKRGYQCRSCTRAEEGPISTPELYFIHPE